ncbi:glycosyltransferase family 4 protein [Thermoactinospora rubra]|uniref:glycosyltransferase family 4 protein n=1 Tax=Thermoactinospora rubra TaxID=1088767 RepID=UPI00146FADB1|nr:glycosyltransferase family 4 protein [Thermoactinospora rubra]
MPGRSRLHVAMVAPPWFEVPPRAYGGIEAVLNDLVRALVRRGHQVTLIGAGRSGTPADFVATYEEPPSSRLGEPMPEVVHAASVAKILNELDADVVHDHSLAGPLLAVNRATPTVVTMHGPAEGELAEYYRLLGRSISLVSISDAQQLRAPGLNWVGTVHNAVDVSTFPFREDKDDYTLFLGRFSPDKGAHLAIDAARAAGRRIVLAGKINEPAEHEYFDTFIRPRLGADAEYVGEADSTFKRELLAGARCLLFPIQWEEPFGMVMIEAMACGTPVVALRRGSVPEVVDDGVTGIVCTRAEELPAAVEAAGALRPAACRTHVELRFDATSMAEGYEKVYEQVVNESLVASLAA